MAVEWVTVRLGDVTDLLTGFPFKSDGYVDDDAAPRLLRGDNVAQGALRWDGAKRWPRDPVDDVGNYLLREGDVILAMDRPWIEAGLKYASVRRSDLPSLLVQRVARLRGTDRLDTRFLRYVIGSQAFTDHVLAVLTGTAVPHISGGQIKNFEFPLPPLPEQRAIAHILGTLDDKIELNRRMNETLEAMARSLFKSWFLDFDPGRAKAEGHDPGLPQPLADLFPDSFEDSELGEIPKGWGVGTLAGFSSLNPETWSKETRPAVIKYVDLSNTKWGRIEAVTAYAQQDAPSRAQRVLRPRDTVVGTVRPGNGSYAFIFEDGLTASTGFAVLRPLEAEFAQFVYLAATAAENIESLSHLADGGAYPAVRPEVIAATQVIRPGGDVLATFSRVVGPLLAKTAENDRESRTLAALRDTLLPMLISGELRVGDARISRSDDS